jgi:hypothetical protein
MKNKLVGFVVLLAVLIGGGWYVASGKIKSPEKRVIASFVNLLNKENGHIKSEISIKPGKDNQTTFQEVKINTDGDFQKGKEGTLELATAFNALGQTQGVSLSGRGEVVLVGGKVFYRIDELPPIFPDYQKVIGQWIGGASNVNIISDVLRGNILKALQEQKIFSEAKKVGSEKIDGVGTTHVRVKLSSAGYASFLAELVKQSGDSAPIDTEQIKKNISQLEGAPLDVWVDSSDNLRKIGVVYTNAGNGNITNVSIYFSKFEGKLKIEAPQNVLQNVVPAVSPSPDNSVSK